MLLYFVEEVFKDIEKEKEFISNHLISGKAPDHGHYRFQCGVAHGIDKVKEIIKRRLNENSHHETMVQKNI